MPSITAWEVITLCKLWISHLGKKMHYVFNLLLSGSFFLSLSVSLRSRRSRRHCVLWRRKLDDITHFIIGINSSQAMCFAFNQSKLTFYNTNQHVSSHFLLSSLLHHNCVQHVSTSQRSSFMILLFLIEQCPSFLMAQITFVTLIAYCYAPQTLLYVCSFRRTLITVFYSKICPLVTPTVQQNALQ